MLLLINEYYGDPRQNFGHSHGAKHVRILPMEVMEAYIYCLCWLVRKLWWLKHLTTQCYTLVCAAMLMAQDLCPLLHVIVNWWIL